MNDDKSDDHHHAPPSPQRPFQIQVRHLIQALATTAALDSKARARAFRLALETFDHYDSNAHDKLSTAIPVLVLCLQKAAHLNQWNEVDLFCRLVGMLFRCSRSRAAVAFQQVGANLFHTLACCLNATDEKDDDPLISGLVHSILSLLVTVASLEVSLVGTKHSSKLLRLLHQIVRGGITYKSSVRREAMRILAGLAQHDDNKVGLMQYPSLVDDILSASQPKGCEDLKAALFCNLSWDVHNQASLLCKDRLVPSLLEWNKSGDLGTRLNVFKTFRRLASSASCNKVSLVKNRSVLKALLVATQQAELCSEAVGVLIRLIGKDTAKRMIKQPGLLQALLSASLPGEDFDCPTSASSLAAQSLKKFAAHIPVFHKIHQDLVDAFLQLAACADPAIRLWAARAFLEQSRLPASNFCLMRTPEVIAAVIKLSNDPVSAIEVVATETLFLFSSNSANVNRVLASSNDVLQIFVEKAGSFDEQSYYEGKNKASCLAVQALLSLVDHEPARAKVAKKLGLIACLSRFGVSDHVDIELKKAAIHGVLLLAPHL